MKTVYKMAVYSFRKGPLHLKRPQQSTKWYTSKQPQNMFTVV